MEHTIIIWKRLKERNTEGKLNYAIATRYTLNENEICESETDKYNEDIDEDSEYEYYAEIEETKF
jgi:hypothetical protein